MTEKKPAVNRTVKVKRKPPGKKEKSRMFELIVLLLFGAGLLFSVLKIGGRASVPYSYDSIIEKYSKEYKVDKDLVAAVIYQESRFDKNVVSDKDARGLMQILPETGEWAAEKMKHNPYSEEDLMDPEVNIKIGTWFLSYLLNYYHGDENLAVAAYNAGPGNVDEWVKDDEYYWGEELHIIPFQETRNYVEVVLEMKDVYSKMYPEEFKKSVQPKTDGEEVSAE